MGNPARSTARRHDGEQSEAKGNSAGASTVLRRRGQGGMYVYIHVYMAIIYSRVRTNRVRLPILLVVS